MTSGLAIVCMLAVGLIWSHEAAIGLAATRSCAAEWVRVLRTNNRGSRPMTVNYKVTYGMVKKEESSRSRSDSHTLGMETEAGAEGEIFSAKVTLSASTTHTTSTSHLSSEQLSSAVERTLTITVPANTMLTVWQLQAKYREFTLGFQDTEVRYNSEKPGGNTVCTIEEKEKTRVTNSMMVRLKHIKSRKYVNTIKRKGWEAATLGWSKDYHFRLVRKGDYVRIRRVNPMFPSYVYLYSSDQGGIYFDRYSSSYKQQWIMSIKKPYIGDVVTFRNRNWQSAGLVKHDGPATSLYCLSTSNLEKFVIEAV